MLTNYYGNDQWDALVEHLTPEKNLMILVEEMTVAISREGVPTTGVFYGMIRIYDVETRAKINDCQSETLAVAFARR